MTGADGPHLVIVANRLPVHWAEPSDGGAVWQPSPGGLVSALAPAIHGRPTTWIGWTGTSSRTDSPTCDHRFDLHAVALGEDEVAGFYNGFSNSTLWPLYHDAIVVPLFDKQWWETYRRVNQRFADTVASAVPPGSLVWIHDYQLQLVPAMLREQRDDLRIGFFLHVPFPAQELFLRLPWREDITRGMLGADVVGFQTEVGAQNFRLIARRLVDGRIEGGCVEIGGRRVRVGTYPVGIDTARVEDIARRASTGQRAREIRAELGNPSVILLGVDRLDYTKGITVRLMAYRELLEEGRIDPSRVVLVQIAQPTRDDVPGYREIRTDVERLVGGINGDFGRLGGVTIRYLHQSQRFDELVALYQAADVMLVTPFRDGMNLVAKEYVASRLDRPGTLVLSEFAGASHQLARAVRVNPFDIDDLKTAIDRAVNRPDHDRRRWASLRRIVTRDDAAAWAARFLGDLQAGAGDGDGPTGEVSGAPSSFGG